MLPSASGTGVFTASAEKVIRFVRMGCTNRPFFHIVVAETKNEQYMPPIEQVGSYDPIPNQYNEKLVALNFERIRHWVANGADVSQPVAELLGLAGYFPINPRSYLMAWRNRRTVEDQVTTEAESKETSS